MNCPVQFYGKIINQTNQPMPGLKVRLALSYFGEIVRPGLRPSHSDFEQTTDGEGEFAVEGRSGLSLDVTLPALRGYDFKPPGLQIGFEDEKSGQPATVVSTREHPYIFHAYRKATPHSLTTGAIAYYDCVPDGHPYVVRLGSSKVAAGGSGGDLAISFQRQPGRMGQTPYDWSVRIDERDFELLESHDDFMSTAPASGYTTSWAYSQPRGTTDFKREVSAHFYVKRRSGTEYGRIEIRLISDYRENSGFVLNYWLNPSGSRDLE